MKPLILVSPDLQRRPTRRGPLVDVFECDQPYTDRILACGGIPVLVPPGLSVDDVAVLVAHADGLLLTGGDFDVDPALFGEVPVPELGTIKPERTRLELALLAAAVQRRLPVLGICGGMQLMNVVRGGTLWQDLPSQRLSTLQHSQAHTKDLAGHDVDVIAGTQLATWCGAGALGVNSTHHQGIKAVGRDLVVSAVATDGLVEGLEDPAGPFFVGVQWHPESMDQAAHRAIYAGLITAARAQRG